MERRPGGCMSKHSAAPDDPSQPHEPVLGNDLIDQQRNVLLSNSQQVAIGFAHFLEKLIRASQIARVSEAHSSLNHVRNCDQSAVCFLHWEQKPVVRDVLDVDFRELPCDLLQPGDQDQAWCLGCATSEHSFRNIKQREIAPCLTPLRQFVRRGCRQGCEVDCGCGEQCLRPGRGRCPPAERLAKNFEWVAVEGLSHRGRLSVVEARS